jgi:hypothetical protein
MAGMSDPVLVGPDGSVVGLSLNDRRRANQLSTMPVEALTEGSELAPRNENDLRGGGRWTGDAIPGGAVSKIRCAAVSVKTMGGVVR